MKLSKGDAAMTPPLSLSLSLCVCMCSEIGQTCIWGKGRTMSSEPFRDFSMDPLHQSTAVSIIHMSMCIGTHTHTNTGFFLSRTVCVCICTTVHEIIMNQSHQCLSVVGAHHINVKSLVLAQCVSARM